MNKPNSFALLDKTWDENKKPTRIYNKYDIPEESSEDFEYSLLAEATESLNEATRLGNFARNGLEQLKKEERLIKTVRDSFKLNSKEFNLMYGIEDDVAAPAAAPAATTAAPAASAAPTAPISTNPAAAKSPDDNNESADLAKTNEVKKQGMKANEFCKKIWAAIQKSFNKIASAMNNFMGVINGKLQGMQAEIDSMKVLLERMPELVPAAKKSNITHDILIVKSPLVPFFEALPGRMAEINRTIETFENNLKASVADFLSESPTSYAQKLLSNSKAIIDRINEDNLIDEEAAEVSFCLGEENAVKFNKLMSSDKENKFNDLLKAVRPLVNIIFYGEPEPKVQTVNISVILENPNVNNILDQNLDKIIQNMATVTNNSSKRIREVINSLGSISNEMVQKQMMYESLDVKLYNKVSKLVILLRREYFDSLKTLQEMTNFGAGITLGIYQEFNKQKIYISFALQQSNGLLKKGDNKKPAEGNASQPQQTKQTAPTQATPAPAPSKVVKVAPIKKKKSLKDKLS
jgi:hypothetical protein